MYHFGSIDILNHCFLISVVCRLNYDFFSVSSVIKIFLSYENLVDWETVIIEFFLNLFHWIQRIQWPKIYDIKRTRTCHTATSCVKDQRATTAPARHMWKIGSLNWAQFMLQWFISFSEFSESSAPFSKNSNVTLFEIVRIFEKRHGCWKKTNALSDVSLYTSVYLCILC